jgi:hypothetical protein
MVKDGFAREQPASSFPFKAGKEHRMAEKAKQGKIRLA